MHVGRDRHEDGLSMEVLVGDAILTAAQVAAATTGSFWTNVGGLLHTIHCAISLQGLFTRAPASFSRAGPAPSSWCAFVSPPASQASSMARRISMRQPGSLTTAPGAAPAASSR